MKQRRLSLYRNPSARRVEFYFYEKDDGVIYYAKSIEMQREDNPLQNIDPIITMSDEDAQIFLDELWRDGFRPSELHEGELSAQSKHLEDMRRIAFKFLEL